MMFFVLVAAHARGSPNPSAAETSMRDRRRALEPRAMAAPPEVPGTRRRLPETVCVAEGGSGCKFQSDGACDDGGQGAESGEHSRPGLWARGETPFRPLCCTRKGMQPRTSRD